MSSCPTLQQANASRRRAWKQMQRLRRLLEASGVPLSPVEKPADFEKEGTALAAALSWLLLDHADRLNWLTRSFTDFCQTAENPPAKHRYGDVKAVMNHLLNTRR